MNIVLYSILFMIVALVFLTRLRNRNVRHVTSAEVKEMLKTRENICFLDVRTTNETRGGMIKGAMCIPLKDLRERLNDLERYRNADMVVYCATGSRSVTAARILTASGFNAYSMRGGIAGWKN